MSNESTTSSAAPPLAPAPPEGNSLGRTLAGWLQANHMSHLGIANTMRLARACNRIKFYQQDRWRRASYRNELAALLEENGALVRPAIQLNDAGPLIHPCRCRTSIGVQRIQKK